MPAPKSVSMKTVAAPVIAAKEEVTKEKVRVRKNFFGMFIGTNRTGKSVTARRYAESWKKQNPKGKIIAFDPQGGFKDIADEFIFGWDKEWEDKIRKMRNSLLIMDDYRLLNHKPTIAKGLFELMNFRAKWNVDCIFVTHSPALVLTQLAFYITHYYIFYTQTQKDSFERKIPNYEICTKASNYINAYVREYGRGDYPNFPHIIVTNEDDDLTLQGVDKQKFLEVIKLLNLDGTKRK